MSLKGLEKCKKKDRDCGTGLRYESQVEDQNLLVGDYGVHGSETSYDNKCDNLS